MGLSSYGRREVEVESPALAHHHTPVASFPPERLIAQEFSVGAGEPDIAKHPIVERSEFGAVMRPPPPVAKCREHPARYIAPHLSPPVMWDRAKPATRYLEVDRRHLSSPKVVERCECAHENHLFLNWRR
jgi:hypothetical protein